METRTPPAVEAERDARARILQHLQDLHRLHLLLAEESRTLKRFTTEGSPRAEIEIATEMLEGYLSASGAFLENMRARFEARLPLLRRGEPAFGAHAEQAPDHGAFWLAFSRLCAVLRRTGRQAEG